MIKIPDNQRVVITGLGVISSLGIGWEEFWRNLLKGTSGISKVTAFDTSEYKNHYAGEIRNFEADKFIPKRKIARIGRTAQYAVAVSKMAVKDAKLTLQELKSRNVGVCLGTTMGEPQVMENLDAHCYLEGERYIVDWLSAMKYPASSIADNVAVMLNLNKHTMVFGNACAAGNYAVGYATDIIKAGRAQMMLAGGVDSLSHIAFTGFNRLLVMAPDMCRPFDKDRKGMILDEGAGVRVLESLQSALRRKAPIYAEILGCGCSCDAGHMTHPSVSGIAKAIAQSLKNSHIAPEKVDYICAHGTGTPENDKAECQAIKNVFGGRSKEIPISSIKSMLGHSMGAASALELINCCLAIKHNKIPPTINWETKDPQCDIDCVPNVAREVEVNIALNNASAFGGNNACVGLGECE